MSSIKQLRLRIINGVNFEDGLLYSEGFDLMNIIELQYLTKLCENHFIEGFAIETSSFNKGEHTEKHIENEFHTFMEYIHADVEENKKGFVFLGELFAKMPYHIIRNSVLDINGDLSLLFASIIPGDIEGTLESLSEIFGNVNRGKSPKIACLA